MFGTWGWGVAKVTVPWDVHMWLHYTTFQYNFITHNTARSVWFWTHKKTPTARLGYMSYSFHRVSSEPSGQHWDGNVTARSIIEVISDKPSRHGCGIYSLGNTLSEWGMNNDYFRTVYSLEPLPTFVWFHCLCSLSHKICILLCHTPLLGGILD